MTIAGVVASGFAILVLLAWSRVIWGALKDVRREGQRPCTDCPLSDDLFPPTKVRRREFDELTIYNNVEGVRTPVKRIMVPRN